MSSHHHNSASRPLRVRDGHSRLIPVAIPSDQAAAQPNDPSQHEIHTAATRSGDRCRSPPPAPYGQSDRLRTLAPYDIFEVNAKNRLQGASAAHWLGTDHLGRDLLTRIIYGARLSLFVGLSATALNVVVALLVGGVSGFVGGRLDLVTQRFVDAWMAFPGLLLLLTIMSIVGRGIPQIIVTLGVSGGIVGSRVVRGAVIGVRENMYFQAARTVGSPTGRTILRHVIPNIAPVLVVIFSINIGGVIISEASLSFLGFGLPIEVPSWGGLLSREGRRYMEQAPHLALWPGLALTITVYCLNNFGDAVRDLLDPRLRGGTGRYDRSRGARRLLETPAAGE